MAAWDEIALGRNAGRRQGGIGRRLGLHAVELGQELAALGQGLGMRMDAEHGVERGPGRTEQAVLDLEHFLADDGQVEAEQQVVDLVDRAGGAVLDREDRALRIAPLHRVEGLAERPIRLEGDGAAFDAEMPQRRLVPVRALGALVGDASAAVPRPPGAWSQSRWRRTESSRISR